MTTSLAVKKTELLNSYSVKKALEEPFFSSLWKKIERESSSLSQVAFLSVLAIGQGPIVFRGLTAISATLEALGEVELFYESIGGVVGYHKKALELLKQEGKIEEKIYLRPPGFNLGEGGGESKKRTLHGLKALAQTGFIFPIGGLGDRLSLKDENGQPLPAATLPFCGRTLLEGLMRDIQGWEHLYFKLYKERICIPVALMTSFEKDNHRHALALCEEKNWFGRDPQKFLLFPQISVPVITEEGNWSMRSENELNLHPGGHGALWRMAEEKGVFSWFQRQNITSLLIRQINNPLCGLDNTLLALLGTGLLENKTFGFACCERDPQAAEGMLALGKDEKGKWSISNIEYTEFKRLGMETEAKLPANTNILYVNIEKILSRIRHCPLPGLILNMKSDVPFITSDGSKTLVKGGRLESMMQNISDSLVDQDMANLPSFVMYNERRKTISVAKRSYEEGKSFLETPVGAFHDFMENGKELLRACGVAVENGLLHFLYHPSLGPIYDVIFQKIRGGVLKAGSELQLEIAELFLENLHLDGSLVIEANNLEVGSCILKNVRVQNKGLDKASTAFLWKNEVVRQEHVSITLRGNGQFYAEDVTFKGTHHITVADQTRLVAYEKEGALHFFQEPLMAKV